MHIRAMGSLFCTTHLPTQPSVCPPHSGNHSSGCHSCVGSGPPRPGAILQNTMKQSFTNTMKPFRAVVQHKLPESSLWDK